MAAEEAHLRRSCSDRASCCSRTSCGCSPGALPALACRLCDGRSGLGSVGSMAAADGGVLGTDCCSGVLPNWWRPPDAGPGGGEEAAAAASCDACCCFARSRRCFTADQG